MQPMLLWAGVLITCCTPNNTDREKDVLTLVAQAWQPRHRQGRRCLVHC